MTKDELLQWLEIFYGFWLGAGKRREDKWGNKACKEIRALIEGKKVSREEIIKWSEEGISISDILGYFDIEVIEPGVEVGDEKST